MPQISYGPPGHKGVSQLVAVGDVAPGNATDDLVHKGLWVAGGAAVAASILGMPKTGTAAVGAFAALFAVCWASKHQVAVVTTAAPPSPTSGWY